MTKVCISTPTKGTLRAETVQWLLSEFVALAPHVRVDIVLEARPLEHARNVQVARFLASDATHLFLLDSDCIPQPGTVARLLGWGLPFVAAPHPSVIDGETGLMVLERAGRGHYRQQQGLRGLVKADAVGCAGMLLRRDVLMALGPRWFRCRYGPDGLLDCGEDFDFCERLIAAGYDVWADCDLAQRHVVSVVV